MTTPTADIPSFIELYDTTLRDGTQMRGISLSVEDKLRIAERLSSFGIHYIEGGWPGSNPKDKLFFQQATRLPFFQQKITAFSSTCFKDTKPEHDRNLGEVLESGVSIVTVFGKTWSLHVTHALETTREENNRMIAETIRYLRQAGKRVIFDAEHYFDGFKEADRYALEAIRVASEAGAELICLCDTNGGTLPNELASIIQETQTHISCPLGIHAHNDSELAVANTLTAVRLGIHHVQGTINGYGERVGNANLCSIIPNLQLKMGATCVDAEQLATLTSLAHYVSELCNLAPNLQQPFVGSNAFAHKGGIHVSAMAKDERTYQHINPHLIGNEQDTLISELAGKSNVLERSRVLGIETTPDEAKRIISEIKTLEQRGFQFDSALASFDLILMRNQDEYQSPFHILDYLVLVEQRGTNDISAEAMVKVRINGEVRHTAAEGNGPVHALDAALRKALIDVYPALNAVILHDYKVRILDGSEGTLAQTRVLIESGNEHTRWSTVGSSSNIIEASFHALVDSLEYGIIQQT